MGSMASRTGRTWANPWRHGAAWEIVHAVCRAGRLELGRTSSDQRPVCALV